jgi:hypothetical protein
MAYIELARMAAGGRPHEGVFLAALDYIEARKDCADFVLHSILRLLYQFSPLPAHLPLQNSQQPAGRLSARLLDRARQAILCFKYWPDEPGADSCAHGRENHYILYASAAYFIGQLYLDEASVNSGHKGRQKWSSTAHILHWLHLRYRIGFAVARTYYDEI